MKSGSDREGKDASRGGHRCVDGENLLINSVNADQEVSTGFRSRSSRTRSTIDSGPQVAEGQEHLRH